MVKINDDKYSDQGKTLSHYLFLISTFGDDIRKLLNIWKLQFQRIFSWLCIAMYWPDLIRSFQMITKKQFINPFSNTVSLFDFNYTGWELIIACQKHDFSLKNNYFRGCYRYTTVAGKGSHVHKHIICSLVEMEY